MAPRRDEHVRGVDVGLEEIELLFLPGHADGLIGVGEEEGADGGEGGVEGEGDVLGLAEGGRGELADVEEGVGFCAGGAPEVGEPVLVRT